MRSIATVFAVLATCLLLAGCTGKPGKSGTVQPNTGGRRGNTIRLGTRGEILLMYDDEFVEPSQIIGISQIGDKLTILPVSGEAVPAWLQITPPVRKSEYWSDTVLAFAPQALPGRSATALAGPTRRTPGGKYAPVRHRVR